MSQTLMPRLDPGRALAFHTASTDYAPTPLTRVALDDHPLWVKDETDRMGLGAFKALGGIYAVARLLGHSLTVDASTHVTLLNMLAEQHPVRPVFVCASAGNHGMAVAEGCRRFGTPCRIHLSETVPEAFVSRLQARAATVIRSGATYEESIAAAIEDAETSGAIHLADGSWPGYTEPPRLVMEGYTVMAEEMRQAFETEGNWPSHVYLQAGVGGLAAAIAFMIRRNWTVQPEIVVVEPEAAPCLKESMAAGQLTTVAGPVSVMGRLDCKDASMLAFEILRTTADRYVTVSEEQAAGSTRIAQSLGYASTPSGTAGLAALLAEPKPPKSPLVIFSEGAEAA